jgi:ribose transport system substrate-binding protein
MLKPSLATFLAFAVALAAFAAPTDVAVIVKAKSSTYWDVVHAGVDKAKQELDAAGTPVTVHWDGPSREDEVAAQAQLVRGAIASHVKAIVLAPSNGQTLVAPVEEAKAAGIPVVIIDSLLSSEAQAATVSTNNYKAGFLAGRALGDALGGKGNVALFRYLKGVGSSQPRESGFLDAMKKYPGIKVVSSDISSGATTAEAIVNAKGLLDKFGAQLNGVFAPNLYSTEGMLAALRQSGYAGKIAFVGFDSSPDMIAALRKGDVTGLTVQQPFMMGYVGLKTAVAAAAHQSVEHEIDTDVKIVTRDNLDSPEVQKLLNP